MTARPARAVAEYGSGLLRTTVLATADGGYTWVRRPGPLRPEPLTGPGPQFRSVLMSLRGPEADTESDSTEGPSSGLDPVLPYGSGADDGLRYDLAGPHCLADLLFTGGPVAHRLAARVLHDLGILIRDLHALAPPSVTPGQRPAIRRLARWVDHRNGNDRLHEALAPLLGRRRWETLVRWTHEVLEPRSAPGSGVVLHGGLGLGLVVPSMGTALRDGLIIGEDVSIGPWQLDIGWLIGELRELRAFASRLTPEPPPDLWDSLESAFLSGYGRGTDRLVRRVGILRSLLHLHDYSTFVAWDSTEIRRYAGLLADLIDDGGEEC